MSDRTIVRHSCAAIGCDARVPRGMLMCLAHWHMVPKALQRAVWRTWRALLQRKGAESRQAYEVAVKAAVDAVYAHQMGAPNTP